MMTEVRVPEVAENVEEGTVISLLVAVGETVELDQSLLELETDKAVVAIPSPVAGKVAEIKVQEGDKIAVGSVIILMETAEAAEAEAPASEAPAKQPDPPAAKPEPTPEPAPKPAPAPTPAPARPSEPKAEQATVAAPQTPEEVAPASPSVRRQARELGVDIHAVRGSGPGGRISFEDVQEHVKRALGGGAGAAPLAGAASAARPLPDFSRFGEIEREKMSRIREITAEAMTHAWTTIPQVTQYDQADITGIEASRKQFNQQKAAEDPKLSMTAILVKVVAEALQRFPRFNASLDLAARELILKKYCHIGFAADTPHGLLVPVIRDADRKGIAELAGELNDLAGRARERKLGPDEMEGGNFTISNLGGIGGTNFSPIVYPPQVAILGVARASKQPVWQDGGFVPRLVMPLSLSYDHRVIDGADGARFLRWIADALQHPLLWATKG